MTYFEPKYVWVLDNGNWCFVRNIRYNRYDDTYTVKFANRELKVFKAEDVDRWQREREQEDA